MGSKTIFISADHGLALIYFLQSDVASTLREDGFEVVVLVADAMLEKLRDHPSSSGLLLEGLRLDQAARYATREAGELQWWLQFLRRVGGSRRIHAACSWTQGIAVA